MDLFANPEALYDRPELEPAQVFAVEEFFASLKYGHLQSLIIPEQDEEEIALAAEALQNGKPVAGDFLSAAGNTLGSLRLMETRGRAPVPAVLRSVVERSLEAPTRETPSLVVRIMNETLEVVKSSFQNVSLQNSEALAVRSSAAPATSPRERTDKFELRQVVSVDLTIFYEILRENGNEVMLRVHLEPEPPHCRVNLLQNGRIVTSSNYVRGENGITFQRLSPGSYRIEIKGDDWDFATAVEIEGK